jgi:hypothetical protein
MARSFNTPLVLAFGLTCLAPIVGSLADWSPMGGLDENRALAPKPEGLKDGLGLTHIAHQSELWWNDHFGFRKLLIGSYRFLSFHLLKMSPNDHVVVGTSEGNHRWLYLDPSTPLEIGFDSLLGKKPYSQADLMAIANNLRRVTALAKKNGVKLALAICPDKQTLYSEHLPYRLRPPPGAKSRLDQFLELSLTLPDVPVVDVRGALRRAKAQTPLYFLTDTHWNRRGAAIGYTAVALALQAQDPALVPVSLASVRWLPGAPFVGDLAKSLGLPTVATESDWTADFSQTEAAPAAHGKLLVLGDSFFHNMKPCFDRQFRQVTFVNGGRAAQSELLTQAMLDQEKPDAVLIEAVERYWTAN